MNIDQFKNQRFVFLAASILCAALIGIALYFEHVMGLEPCPLCIFQRVVIIATGVVCFAAFLQNPAVMARRIYGTLIGLLSISGIALAGRHLWLQSLPPEKVPTCGPGLEYLLNVFPLMQVLEFVLKGSGECAKVSWTFLGISIPGWTLLIFIGFLAMSIGLLFTRIYLPRQ